MLRSVPKTLTSSSNPNHPIHSGTMTFGEQNTLPESFRLLDLAFSSGVNFLDSAEMYPVPQRPETYGRSEDYVGRWLRNRKIPRDRLVLSTKVSGPSGQMTWIRDGPKSLDAYNISEAIDGSLSRLRTDFIDLYQIHWPDRYVPMFGETEYEPSRQFSSIPIEDQLDALGKAISAGKIRYIGLSNETPYGLMKFLQLARNAGISNLVSLQNSYNLLCRHFDFGLAECCHHESISLLAYSPLAMGILSGKYFSPGGGPSDARINLFRGRYAEGESRYNLSKDNVKMAARKMPRNVSIVHQELTWLCLAPCWHATAKRTRLKCNSVKEYVDVALKFNLSPVSMAIAFVLNHPLVAAAIFGATKPWQFKEVLGGIDIHLSEDILSELNVIHEKYPNPCP